MSGRNATVVHITSSDSIDWKMAIRNVSNLYNNDDVATPAERLKVVVNGDAIRFLLASSPEADRVRRMTEAGIQIEACENSFERFGYDTDNLVEGVTTVSSGVAEVVRLQRRGVSYLKLP